MKIAIHNRKGSYSERWVEYCENNQINYKLVNAYSNNIVEEISDCNIFMWHHHHSFSSDINFARQLLFSLEQSGKTVFPNFKTGWHFDDKLGQKYLFEALKIPVAPSYAFYNKKEALSWAEKTSYPKVFKLRGGAGSSNVRLIKSYKEARRHIKTAFSTGFKTTDRWNGFKDKIKSFKNGKGSLRDLSKSFVRLFIKSHNEKMQPLHKGYIYFQEFIENDGFDYRMTFCNDRCVPWVRYCMKNDFRASGGHDNHCNPDLISKDLIDLTFNIADKLGSNSCAFDFVRKKDTGELYLIENSYCYAPDEDEFDYGYFDRKGLWHEESFNGIDWVLEEAIKDFESSNK